MVVRVAGLMTDVDELADLLDGRLKIETKEAWKRAMRTFKPDVFDCRGACHAGNTDLCEKYKGIKWLPYYKRFNPPPVLGEDLPCCVHDCKKTAAHGAHVHTSAVEGKEDMLCIVPTCAGHNPKDADKRIGCMRLKAGTVAVETPPCPRATKA